MNDFKVFFWFVCCSLFFGACSSNTSVSQTPSKTIKSMIDNKDNLTKEQKTDTAIFAAGCFWCVEGQFKYLDGVQSVKSGYIGGTTQNPTYEQVCSGSTGHAEAVRVIFDANKISYDQLLAAFFVSHDPTQLNRQGNDIGTQYRSAIYTHGEAQQRAAMASKKIFGEALAAGRHGPITTEIAPAPQFFFAEDYHQQYLAKNPAGYCGLGGTGVACQIGTGVAA